MAYGWEGEKVRLAPLDKLRHLEGALRWLNDPEVTRWTLIGDLPIHRLMEEEFFDRMTRGSDTDVVFAVETREGEHVGFSSLHRIDWRHGCATTGMVLGRTDLWGRGYGSEAARLRASYAFEVLGLRLLLAEAMEDNVASIRVLLKAGYRQTGRVPRRYWKRGAFRDVLQFALERT